MEFRGRALFCRGVYDWLEFGTVMVSIGLTCNAAMLIQSHTLSQGRGDAAVKHLSPAEIESTNKILLGPLGLDRAWEYWRVRAGFPARDESR
jgi:hypothetical protein